MAGLSDMMAYQPAGAGLMEGMTHGANIRNTMASAGQGEAMAARARAEMEKMSFEQQETLKKSVREVPDRFFNNVATYMMQGMTNQQAMEMAAQSDPEAVPLAQGFMSRPDLMQNFTPENAQKRLTANPQAQQAFGVQAMQDTAAMQRLGVTGQQALGLEDRQQAGKMEQIAATPHQGSTSDMMRWLAMTPEQQKVASGYLAAAHPPTPIQGVETKTKRRMLINPETGLPEDIEEVIRTPVENTSKTQSQYTAAQLGGVDPVGMAQQGTPDGPAMLQGTPVVVHKGKIYLQSQKKK